MRAQSSPAQRYRTDCSTELRDPLRVRPVSVQASRHKTPPPYQPRQHPQPSKTPLPNPSYRVIYSRGYALLLLCRAPFLLTDRPQDRPAPRAHCHRASSQSAELTTPHQLRSDGIRHQRDQRCPLWPCTRGLCYWQRALQHRPVSPAPA